MAIDLKLERLALKMSLQSVSCIVGILCLSMGHLFNVDEADCGLLRNETVQSLQSLLIALRGQVML